MEDRELLLKMNRQFSRDETVVFLIEHIKKLNLEIGYLNSEISDSKWQK